MNTNSQQYKRDVTFTCDKLTLWEGLLLKHVVEAFSKGKIVHLESDEDFEKRMSKKVKSK